MVPSVGPMSTRRRGRRIWFNFRWGLRHPDTSKTDAKIGIFFVRVEPTNHLCPHPTVLPISVLSAPMGHSVSLGLGHRLAPRCVQPHPLWRAAVFGQVGADRHHGQLCAGHLFWVHGGYFGGKTDWWSPARLKILRSLPELPLWLGAVGRRCRRTGGPGCPRCGFIISNHPRNSGLGQALARAASLPKFLKPARED